MRELRIKNRSERDLRSCEVTQAVINKAHDYSSYRLDRLDLIRLD